MRTLLVHLVPAAAAVLLLLLGDVLLLPANAATVDDEAPAAAFRMEKINFLWTKAADRLRDSDVVAKLRKELKKFDDLFLNIKQTGEKGLAEVEEKLQRMLERFDLADVVHAFQMKYKHEKTRMDAAVHEPPVDFEDERVRRFWSEVEADGAFTADELKEIRRLFVAQDARCREYAAALRAHKQLDDNHVHSHHDHAATTASLKQQNAEIERQFEELRHRLTDVRENPFKDAKVRELWTKARTAPGMIPNELDAIRTELRHLDRQRAKLEHHSEHLAEHALEWTPEEAETRDRILRKLKKLEAHLESKIEQHTEL
ncbi:hypothetical protein M3Y99_01191600 [Aphelenchoides fujianensis]|nr:hypothetical protein M3Y99_01191600 [Aphelenchoides fujianensis]